MVVVEGINQLCNKASKRLGLGMDNQFDTGRFARAVSAMVPRSKLSKQLTKLPLIGNAVVAIRELSCFRDVFFVRRVIAEQGLGNWALVFSFINVLVLGWALSISWKFIVAGVIVTFTEPNTLSVVILCAGFLVVVLFSHSALNCAAFAVGTWRHATGKATVITNIPGKKNVFTPKDFGKHVRTFETPSFPKLHDLVPTSPLETFPVMSSVLTGDETDLVWRLVNDVNAMTSTGLYRIDEIWPELIGLYYLDFYVAQVRNGGHSQFTHNARSNFQQVLDAVEDALSNTHMPQVSEVFDAYRQWCLGNPKLITEQTGFTGGRAPELDELDQQLYSALDKVVYPSPLAGSVSKWGFVRALPDDEYTSARAALLEGNPDSTRRKLIQQRNVVREFLNSRERLAAMLALNAANNQDFLTSIPNGAQYDFDEEQAFAWRFQHSGGQGYLRLRGDGYDYHPQIGENLAIPSFHSGVTQEEMTAAFDRYKASEDKPRPGPLVSQVPLTKLDGMQPWLNDGRYADFIFATLVAAGLDPDVRGMVLGRYPERAEGKLIVLVGNGQGRVFKIEIMPNLFSAVEEVTQGQVAQMKKFKHRPLQTFLRTLDAGMSAP